MDSFTCKLQSPKAYPISSTLGDLCYFSSANSRHMIRFVSVALGIPTRRPKWSRVVGTASSSTGTEYECGDVMSQSKATHLVGLVYTREGSMRTGSGEHTWMPVQTRFCIELEMEERFFSTGKNGGCKLTKFSLFFVDRITRNSFLCLLLLRSCRQYAIVYICE